MKYSETQMLLKANKILKDLFKQYFKEENVEKIWFNEKADIPRQIGKVMSTWTVCVYDSLSDADEFLTISDETGEPLYYQNANTIITEIARDENGNYYRNRKR